MTDKMVDLMKEYKESLDTFSDDGVELLAALLYIKQGYGAFKGDDSESVMKILVEDRYCSYREAEALIDSDIDSSLVYRWINKNSFYDKTCICITDPDGEHSDWCTALKAAYGFCDGCHGCSVPCGKAKS